MRRFFASRNFTYKCQTKVHSYTETEDSCIPNQTTTCISTLPQGPGVPDKIERDDKTYVWGGSPYSSIETRVHTPRNSWLHKDNSDAITRLTTDGTFTSTSVKTEYDCKAALVNFFRQSAADETTEMRENLVKIFDQFVCKGDDSPQHAFDVLGGKEERMPTL